MTVAWDLSKLAESETERAIVADLRHVISRGIWRFDARDLARLPSLFSDGAGPASTHSIRVRLLGLLMANDPNKDPDVAPGLLFDDTNCRLTIFRACNDARHVNLTVAREKASEHVSEISRTADGVRKEGGLEWYIVKELLEAVTAELRPVQPLAAKPRPRVESERTGETHADLRSPQPAVLSPLARDLNRPVASDELQKGFWWRESTVDYISQLADLEQVTLYAGADGPADIGPPIHQELVATLIRETLIQKADADSEVARQVVAVLVQCLSFS